MGGVKASDLYVEAGYIEEQDKYISWGPIVFWEDKLVVIPRNMMTWVSGDNYILDTAILKQQLNYLEASELGIAHDVILRHKDGTILSGVWFAGFLEFINGYTVTFENGLYSANVNQMYNINLMDVVNTNYVSVRVQNSAGNQILETGASVLSSEEHGKLMGIDTLTANEVWQYNGTNGRTLTVQTGMTAEQNTQLMNLPTSGDIATAVMNAINTTGVTLTDAEKTEIANRAAASVWAKEM